MCAVTEGYDSEQSGTEGPMMGQIQCDPKPLPAGRDEQGWAMA